MGFNINDILHGNVVQEQLVEEEEKVSEAVDYKMITFTLGGKDYAIDIMDVKEIAKTGRFTYVPNTLPFVLGVYNLRGEIIPIIDLRIFFHLSVPKKDYSQGGVEDMIIVTMEDQLFGIVVDGIDKVVGISKSTIQPPHPIFGDINIKYILGIVENAGKLFILLDINRIFGNRNKSSDHGVGGNLDNPLLANMRENYQSDEAGQYKAGDRQDVGLLKTAEALLEREGIKNQKKEDVVVDVGFIAKSLENFVSFYISDVNTGWVAKRLAEWKSEKGGSDYQIQNVRDANVFLEDFESPDSGKFWSDIYAEEVGSVLSSIQSKVINVWNVGCGAGYETYSLACVLKEKFPSARIMIHGNDSDLLKVANAPNMTFALDDVPSRLHKYMVQGVNGRWSFNQEIKDIILFEYHDCTNENPYPEMDLVFIRDVLSYLNPQKQKILVDEIVEKLKTDGILVVGSNETVVKDGLSNISKGRVSAFKKE